MKGYQFLSLLLEKGLIFSILVSLSLVAIKGVDIRGTVNLGTAYESRSAFFSFLVSFLMQEKQALG